MAAVFICDLRKSRTIPRWTEVLIKLQHVLAQANTTYRSVLLVPFDLTVGDEFQGVLRVPQNACEVLRFFKTTLPVPFYCGIGLGPVELHPSFTPRGMRGEGFYRAREALEKAKRERRQSRLASGVFLYDRLANALLGMMEALEQAWTPRQREVVHLLRRHPDWTYEVLGDRLGISKQAVAKRLRSAHFKRLVEGEEALTLLLSVNPEELTFGSQPDKVDKGGRSLESSKR